MNFERIGFWWNSGIDKIELVRIDGVIYALDGWNGEAFCDCWVCAPDEYTVDESAGTFTIRPVYEQLDDDFEVVGYEVN